MDELIDILDSEGNYTGETALKSEAHAKGLFHPTIHVWCYTRSGKILLQQRGKNKETHPLKWDVSVAGHIGAGESPKIGAIREVEEEIGVILGKSDIEKIDFSKMEKRHSNTLYDREFNHAFLCLLDENTILTKQESEVEDLQWLTLAEFQDWIHTRHPDLVPNSEERFATIIDAITSRL